jgi:hypothetical protein
VQRRGEDIVELVDGASALEPFAVEEAGYCCSLASARGFIVRRNICE